MAEQKERFEILLENIQGDVRAVLDGHGVLDKKIEDVKDMIKEVDTKVEDTGAVVKEISRCFKEHMLMPAHAAV